MSKVLIAMVLALFVAQHSYADYKKILNASKNLNSSYSEASVKILKEAASKTESKLLRQNLVELVSNILMEYDEAGFNAFKNEFLLTNPNQDFSFLAKNAGDYKGAYKKTYTYFAMNLLSQAQVSQNKIPQALNLNPRKEPVPYDAIDNEPTRVVDVSNTQKTPIVVVEQEIDINEDPRVVAAQKALQDAEDAARNAKKELDKDNIYYEVYHAAVKVEKSDNSGIKELIRYCYKGGDLELTKAVSKAMALGMKNTSSKSLPGFAAKMNKKYPTDGLFDFMQQEPLQVDCAKCDGSGEDAKKCTECRDGKCRNCKGTGRFAYTGLGNKIEDKPCPVCKEKTTCIKCDGTQEEKFRCRSCYGRKVRFVKAAVASEYVKALKYVLTLAPKLADDKGIYIGVGVDKAELARIAQLKQARIDAKLQLELAAKTAREENEARILAAKKAAEEAASLEEDDSSEMIDDEGTTPRLKHAILEVRNYLNAQERRGINFYDKCYGKWVDSQPTLYIVMSTEFIKSDRNFKSQLAEGFYRFWKLRAGNNGLGGKAQLVLLNGSDEVIGGNKGEDVWIK